VQVVKVAALGFAGVMALLAALNLGGIDRLDLLLVLLFVGYCFLGMVVPTSAVLALDDHGQIAGTASALLGTVQFVVGALVMAVVGLFVDGSARPMLLGIAGSALLTLALTYGTLGGSRAASTAAS